MSGSVNCAPRLRTAATSAWFSIMGICVALLGSAGCSGGGGGDTAQRDANGVLIGDRWANLEEVFADAPPLELVEHEVEWDKETLVLLAPAGAEVRPGKSDEGDAVIKVILSPTQVLRFSTGHWEMETCKELSEKLFNRARSWAYADEDLLIVEYELDEADRYNSWMNVSAGPHDFLARLERPQGDIHDELTLDDCLLLMKCARSIRLKEPMPEDPLAALARLDVHVSPQTDDPEMVEELRFSAYNPGGHLEFAPKFPNLKSVDVSSGQLIARDYEPLIRCPSLEALELSEELETKELKVISQLKSLKSLEVRLDLPEDIAYIGKLAHLQQLKLNVWGYKAEASAADLQPLAQLAQLRELDLTVESEGKEPQPEFLGFLEELTALRTLELMWAAEGEMGPVGRLNQLEELVLKEPRIGDASLELLGKMAQLRRLSIDVSYQKENFAATTAGLAHLAGLESLQELSFNGVAADDSTLAVLAALPNLQTISLRNAAITDAGLDHFRGMKNLKKLTLSGCKDVSKEKIDALKADLEGVEIGRY